MFIGNGPDDEVHACVCFCVAVCDLETTTYEAAKAPDGFLPHKKKHKVVNLVVCFTDPQEQRRNTAMKASNSLHLPDLPVVGTVALTDQVDPGLCAVQTR